jgi:quercetin dioxygenase-like cupin family protein
VSTFLELQRIRPHILREGVIARVVTGERMTLAVVELEPGATVPEHKHENEQLGFVISGTITMRIGSETLELHPGDTYSIPSNVPHEATAGIDGSTVVDAFAPLRADWANLKRSEPSAPRWLRRAEEP